MRYWTSDTHFWHTKVIGFCERPFASIEEMNETFIANWNSVVMPEDTIYHLGDFSFGGFHKSYPIVQRLNGTKFVIYGNHDWKNKMDKRWQRYGFAGAYHKLELTIDGEVVNMSHYPYTNKSHDTRTFEDQLSDDGKILIHGHVHEKWKVKERMINVGVDVWGFKPVSEAQIIEEMNKIRMNDVTKKEI